jgi:hypothetical protein
MITGYGKTIGGKMSDSINEKWLPVREYEGIYEISSIGRVRSLRKNRLLSPWVSKKGYFIVDLTKEGVRTHRSIHSLVAEAFIGKRPNGLVIRHLDGNPTNNIPENLAYGTQSENEQDSVRHGTHYRNHKLTVEQAKQIASDPRRYKEIAKDFGTSVNYVSDIKAGLFWGRETVGIRIRGNRTPVNKYIPTEEQRKFICDKNNSRVQIMKELGISLDVVKRIRRENRLRS